MLHSMSFTSAFGRSEYISASEPSGTASPVRRSPKTPSGNRLVADGNENEINTRNKEERSTGG